MSLKNVMVAQSGGPTVAINASLAGVIRGVMASEQYETVYGSVNGILGILNNHLLNLTEIMNENPAYLDRLETTPAMYLGSCRHKLPDYLDDDSSYVFIFKQFELYNVGAFFYIGGNDSMDTVLKLSEYGKKIGSNVRIIGIPKTIDNDLCETDHTPGFGSAAKYIASSVLEIAHDTFIYAVKSVTIIEIMGRDAGWLTAAAALARNGYNSAPHLIYLPEVPFDTDDFLLDVKRMLFERNNVIIAVSEGIRDASGNYISASEKSVDTFGHSQLSGAGKTLEFLVKEKLGVKVVITKSKNNRVNLQSLMIELGKIGIDGILLEGGATLSFSALEENIVDKIQVYIAPKIIGGEKSKTSIGGQGIKKLSDAIELKDMTVKSISPDLLVEAYLRGGEK